eukprot:TRINITY_DN16481_c0_g1_i1.p1 TRINITY_DN16481_c0_g1~~TRINITY_DN16481_c0_g1_i1.p1  ORF type:complete len:736 (+),score=115.95 TRINITY_DN16481_c0_g1_i1:90-2297(+)
MLASTALEEVGAYRLCEKFDIFGFIHSVAGVWTVESRREGTDERRYRMVEWSSDRGKGLSRDAVRELALLSDLARDAREPTSLPRIRDCFVGCGRLHLVYDCAARVALHEFLHEGRNNLSPLAVQRWTRDLVRGMEHLHSRGYLHRHLRPSTILVDGDVKLPEQMRLLLHTVECAGRHSVHVTPCHNTLPSCSKPPEILAGSSEWTPAADMWSLGIVIDNIAAGQFTRGARQVLTKTELMSDICWLVFLFQRLGTPLPPHPLTRLKDFPRLAPRFRPQAVVETSQLLGSAGERLLALLLRLDPDSRADARELLHHEFLQKEPSPTEDASDELAARAFIQRLSVPSSAGDGASGEELFAPNAVAGDAVAAEASDAYTNGRGVGQASTSPASSSTDPATEGAERLSLNLAADVGATSGERSYHRVAKYYLQQDSEEESLALLRRRVQAQAISTSLLRVGCSSDDVCRHVWAFLYQRGLYLRDNDYFLTHYPWWTVALRAALLDWVVQLQVYHNTSSRVVFLVTELVDKFLVSSVALEREQYAHLYAGAFLLAAKACTPPEEEVTVNAQELARQCAGAISAQVEFMEIQLLPTLQHCHVSWGPYDFLVHYAYSLCLPRRHFRIAHLCLERSILHYKMLLYSPGLLACAACCLAIELAHDANELSDLPSFPVKLQRETGRTWDEVQACMVDLRDAVWEFDAVRWSEAGALRELNASYLKFSLAAYEKVAASVWPKRRKD